MIWVNYYNPILIVCTYVSLVNHFTFYKQLLSIKLSYLYLLLFNVIIFIIVIYLKGTVQNIWCIIMSPYRDDPFDICSVNNCVVTGDDRAISRADAVVIHVQHGVLPSVSGRRASQRWVFLSDESPVNSFSMAGKRPNLSEWANIFNWSMTYRWVIWQNAPW